MELMRMQFACLSFILFISFLYFCERRGDSYIHKIFSCLLIVNILNLVFDMITVYTVNHLDEVPEVFNRIAHNIFIESVNLIVYLVSLYTAALIDIQSLKKRWLRLLWVTPMAISIVFIIFGDLYYMETPKGNYSYGIAATTCYISVAIYLFLSIGLMIGYWSKIEKRKRNVVFFALTIMVGFSCYQAVEPTALISCLGSSIITFSIFVTMENPDKVLMEMYGQEKLRADAANKAKSNFLANMSHEIRTPINAVIGMNEMILREYDDPTLMEYSTYIKNSSNTLLSLVNDILDFSKIESGKMEIISVKYNLSSIINDLVTMILVKVKEKGLELHLDIVNDIPDKLLGDDIRLKQVMTNLLTNAVKYTKKGSITLKIHWVKVNDDTIDLIVSVKDTGIGIKEDNISNLFETFHRIEEARNRNIEGTGLGLNITAQLLSKMGSMLEVHSVYNEGSTFSFKLTQKVISFIPIGDFREMYENSLKSNHRYQESFTAPDGRILIVDDNEINLKVAKALLKKTKLAVHTASSGGQCLAMIQEQFYHMIFLDHMMPDMDGVETLTRMKQLEVNLCKDSPVIMLSANAISGAKEMYINSGFDDYLSKPIDAVKLEQTLIHYLPEDIVLLTNTTNSTNNPIDDKVAIEEAISMEEGLLMEEGLTTEESILTEERISTEEEVATKQGDNLTKNSHDYPWTHLDPGEALSYCKSEEVFRESLKLFYLTIPKKVELIRQYEVENRIKEYTIEVHSLKSSAKLIGAKKLYELAMKLEECGNLNDIITIHDKTEELLQMYEEYQQILQPYAVDETSPEHANQTFEYSELLEMLRALKVSLEEFDIDQADQLIKQLGTYKLSNDMSILYKKIKDCVTIMDEESAIHWIDMMSKKLNETHNTITM